MMTTQEFAPVTPGEMLKEEFLAEYGLSQNELAKAVGISPTALPTSSTIAAYYRRHGASAGALFRQ